MQKIKIASSQFSFLYGDQLHFPYSIATLVAYLKQFPSIKDSVEFTECAVERQRLDEYVETFSDADILLCSCYVWNWEITNFLALRVKMKNPKCLVVFGGPHVPDRSEDFFEQVPFVDILVHKEGEITCEKIVSACMFQVSLDTIPGITTKKGKNRSRERIDDLSEMPSPYLNDLMFELVKRDNANWIASWETNRGCPYSCTFCDWGSAVYSKVRQFSIERLHKEIEWFADNKIDYVDCCDANFGIFSRDVLLAEKLATEKGLKGYPKTFRQSWTKNSSEKILDAARVLKKANLLTAVGLALESLDESVLSIVRRRNISFGNFSDLTALFEAEGITTYTELIRGLPGETYESFANGLSHLIANTDIDNIAIYNCSVLPNAELNDPLYKSVYEIESVRSPIYLAHSTPGKQSLEFEQIVISTNTYSLVDLKRMHMLSWVVLTFHVLGLTEYIAKFFKLRYNIELIGFYEFILKHIAGGKTVFSSEYRRFTKYIEGGYEGYGWTHKDEELGEITWPYEEASWLRIVNSDLVNELKTFIAEIYRYMNVKQREEDVLNSLCEFQAFMLTSRSESEVLKLTTAYNWLDFFDGEHSFGVNFGYTFKRRNRLVSNGSFHDWCKETIWYGRRTRMHKAKLFEVERI